MRGVEIRKIIAAPCALMPVPNLLGCQYLCTSLPTLREVFGMLLQCSFSVVQQLVDEQSNPLICLVLLVLLVRFFVLWILFIVREF